MADNINKRLKVEEGTGPFVTRYISVPADPNAELIVMASGTFTDDESDDGTTIKKDKELWEDQLEIFDIGDYSHRDFLRFNWTHGCRVEKNNEIGIPVSKFRGDIDNLWDWYCNLIKHEPGHPFRYKVVLDKPDGEIQGTKMFESIEMMHAYLVRKVEKHHQLIFTDDQKLVYDKEAIVSPDLGMKYGNLEATVKASKRVGKTTVTVSFSAFKTLNYVTAFKDMIRKENVDELEFALLYDKRELRDTFGQTSDIFGSLGDFVAFLKTKVVALKKELFEHRSTLARMKSKEDVPEHQK